LGFHWAPALQSKQRRGNDAVRAVVLFYSTGGGQFDKIDTVFLGHFTENDNWGAHTKIVNVLTDRICSTGQKTTFYPYPDTEHCFAASNRPEYDQKAAEFAWERTIEFLHQELG
jgi:carboxymethylenebutenolidase